MISKMSVGHSWKDHDTGSEEVCKQFTSLMRSPVCVWCLMTNDKDDQTIKTKPNSCQPAAYRPVLVIKKNDAFKVLFSMLPQ